MRVFHRDDIRFVAGMRDGKQIEQFWVERPGIAGHMPYIAKEVYGAVG